MRCAFQLAGLKAIVLVAASNDRAVCDRGSALHAVARRERAGGRVHDTARGRRVRPCISWRVRTCSRCCLLPLCLWMLEADRRKNTPWLWALIPVTALWTNLHGGFVDFSGLRWIAAAGLRNRSRARSGSPARNPPLHRIVIRMRAWQLSPTRTESGCMHISGSTCAPIGSRTWCRNFRRRRSATKAQLQFEILLLAGLITAGFLLRRRLFAEALWVVFLAHASLTSVRHAPLYVAVAAPIVALPDQPVVARRNGGREEVSMPCGFCTS